MGLIVKTIAVALIAVPLVYALLALWKSPCDNGPTIIRGWPEDREEAYKRWCHGTGRKYHPQGKYTSFQQAQRIINNTINRLEPNRRKSARK